ncbi:PQQ-dependent sugar dehydrogenase [Sphingobium sp. CAP-1]|uniref:PQQ-dependent sugar dehydrogenase n=1 Tax=Sphingobium sp. CAP-1 TaxID=2676077 RepID=UPI0012BB401A|nr:PQQ-dependent sugar dehydrogenase [Sphingobium sp. CAP-1]QGP80899.1 PQQ-dependent sugar dehydrogenase [Sphingobium sp. CAP-1]
MKFSASITLLLGAACLALTGCGGGSADSAPVTPTPTPTPPPRAITGVTSTPVATFAAPWSLAFLPDGRMLVTERPASATKLANPTESGSLRLVSATGTLSDPIEGLPANIGLLDVKLDPAYASNGLIYISYMERDSSAPRVGRNAGEAGVDPAGLALVRGTLRFTGSGARLDNASIIWRQAPKIVANIGSGEPGGRIAFSPDGRYLFLAAGDRQELDKSLLFALDNTLGKIIRIYPDGAVPSDNPYRAQAGALPEIWSIGHRNPYGLAFDGKGLLWENEMGPKGGDELNRIDARTNYGWPAVSYGDNYDGSPITKPATGDGYAPSTFWWTPVIAPSDMIFYTGTQFADWRGDAIITGLQSRGLVRMRINGDSATEMQRIDMGARIRAVAQAPDGALWVLEDQPSGRLLKLAPIFAP